MIQFLVDNPLFALLLCLGVGYLVGKIDLGVFPNDATLGTLYAAVAMNLIVSASGGGEAFDAEHLQMIKILFFALFLFILGYEAGPVLRNSIRATGLKSSVKAIALSLFYSVSVFILGYLLTRLFGFDVRQANGFIPGSQTSEPTLNAESDVIAYVLNYLLATLGMVVFVQKAAPLLVGTDLISAVKDKIDAGGALPSRTLRCPCPCRFAPIK